MRALKPIPELFECNGKPLTKTAQIALAGNSVCPQVAEAIVASNVRGTAGWTTQKVACE